MKARYGKKKRPLLPSLSELRDSVTPQKSRREVGTNDRGLSSPASPLTITQSDRRHTIPPRHNSAFDEVASLLLEDTIMEEEENHRIGPHRQSLPHLPSAATMPSLSMSAYNNNQSLPQASAPFNTRSMKSSLTGSSAKGSRAWHGQEREDKPAISANFSNHNRQGSGPTIPRKSSRRQSANLEDKAGPSTYSPTDIMEPVEQVELPTSSSRSDVTGAIRDIAAGNKKIILAREAGEEAARQHQLPSQIPSKKRRLKDNLTKVKTAFNGQFKGRDAKTEPASPRDNTQSLMDNRSTQKPNNEETSPDSMEFSLNNLNLKKPKIHITIPQKAVGSASRSSSCKESSGVSSSELSQSNRISRVLREATPDMQHPISRFTARNMSTSSPDFNSRGNMSIVYNSDFLDMSSPVHTPRTRPLRRKQTTHFNYEANIDAMLSSSPVDQSTPRLRLEPTENAGKRRLTSVPAGDPSVFDSEMSAGSVQHDSQVDSMPPSVSYKKHRSPSKETWEDYQEVFNDLYGVPESRESFTTHDHAPLDNQLALVDDNSTVNPNAERLSHYLPPAMNNLIAQVSSGHFGNRLAPVAALRSKDTNTSFHGHKRHGYLAQKSDLNRSADFMPQYRSRQFRQQDSLPANTKKLSHRDPMQDEEIDELADPKYDFGEGKDGRLYSGTH